MINHYRISDIEPKCLCAAATAECRIFYCYAERYYAGCQYDGCHYAGCHYAELRGDLKMG
jgi:hypothetical protein